MRKINPWSIKKHLKLSVLIVLISIIAGIVSPDSFGLKGILKNIGFRSLSSSESSVAIIGGADGPTSIYVSGSPIKDSLFSGIVLFAVLTAIYVPIKYFVNKDDN